MISTLRLCLNEEKNQNVKEIFAYPCLLKQYSWQGKHASQRSRRRIFFKSDIFTENTIQPYRKQWNTFIYDSMNEGGQHCVNWNKQAHKGNCLLTPLIRATCSVALQTRKRHNQTPGVSRHEATAKAQSEALGF